MSFSLSNYIFRIVSLSYRIPQNTFINCMAKITVEIIWTLSHYIYSIGRHKENPNGIYLLNLQNLFTRMVEANKILFVYE